jgi:chromosome partitioning protein
VIRVQIRAFFGEPVRPRGFDRALTLGIVPTRDGDKYPRESDMRRIAVINQKGGVGKTTTSVNLGAALAEQGRRVVVVDMDPQANLSLHLGLEVPSNLPSVYTVLHGATSFAEALKSSSTPGMSVLPSNIDLSGAELELASVIGRDNLLADSIDSWESEHRQSEGEEPADYVIFDCPPSLGLLSINALAAATEVIVTVQTEFLALMGMSKLVDVVNLIRRRLNPGLRITGIAPCLYDSRLRLAREVLGEIRKYFPGQVFKQVVRCNVKLAEAPSFSLSIIEYAPDSNGAQDYRRLAAEVIAQEEGHPELADLPPPRPVEELPRQLPTEPKRLPVPTPRKKAPKEKAEPPPPSRPAPTPRASAGSEEEIEEQPETTHEVVLRPQPPPASRGRDAVDEELRVMRSQDLPPLPPDAFEVPRS